MPMCKHRRPFEERCSLCVEEGLAREAEWQRALDKETNAKYLLQKSADFRIDETDAVQHNTIICSSSKLIYVPSIGAPTFRASFKSHSVPDC